MKQKKKRAALLSVAFAAMMLAAGCGSAEIGYVDPTRVEKEAPAIMSIDAEMKTKMEEVQKQAEDDFKAKQAQNCALRLRFYQNQFWLGHARDVHLMYPKYLSRFPLIRRPV